MKDDEIGLTFFTEGRPRTPDGMPSVFGAIDQAEILARIDEVQEDDLASSFFADSLVEVENAATKIFDVGLRARSSAAVEPVPDTAPALGQLAEPVIETVLMPEPIVVEHTVVEHRVIEETVVEETVVEETVVEHVVAERTVVEETRLEETRVEETVVMSTSEQPAEVSPRLGVVRADAVGLPTRTVITVPGILAKSADARRSFILGGPAAVTEEN